MVTVQTPYKVKPKKMKLGKGKEETEVEDTVK